MVTAMSLRNFVRALLLAALAAPSLVFGQAEVPGAATDRLLSWRLERAWQIGGAADESLLLSTLFAKDLAGDRQGHLYVVDRLDHQVVAYDSTGRRVRSYGREGQGPGELGTPLWVDVRVDGRILVGDVAKNAVVVFAPDGSPEPELPVTSRLRSQHSLAGGGHVGIATRTRDSLALFLHADGAPVALVRMVAPRPRSTPPVCGLTDYPAAPIFAPTIVWAARGDRIVASTGAFRLQLFNRGAPVRVLTRATPLRPSSTALARRHLGSGATMQLLGRPPCIVPADLILSVAEIAPTLPAYAALAIVADDRIWATRYTVRGEPGLADVYHPERGYEGSVALGTARPALFLSTGLLISIEQDEDDVPVIRAYRVVRK